MTPAAHEEVWRDQRRRLFGIAYRMLGSVTEAEDVLSEAFVRFQQAEGIEQPAAWLTTVTTRLAIDQLRSAKAQREVYVGPWLPEPIVADDPADQITLGEGVSMALLVVLETLSPAERAVFVLREAFGYEYDEIAAIVGRSTAACRQLAHRAREHVAARRPRFDADPAHGREIASRFLDACLGGRIEDVVALLDPDVVLVSDGGGIARAARHPIIGAANAARFLVGIIKAAPRHSSLRIMSVNGGPGAIAETPDGPVAVMALDFVGDRIAAVRIVANPQKLRRPAQPDR
jgi:RNA polymerase sigma-70 factor (ECF subfamily)